MGVLSRAALVALLCAGCYEPQLADCQVTCTGDGADECAGDQVCSDGWCVAPAAVGACTQRVSADASAPAASVHVTIKGRGRVELLDEACESAQDMGDACTFDVVAGASITLVAVETGWRFDKWESDNCRDEDERCTLDVADDVTVAVKFKR